MVVSSLLLSLTHGLTLQFDAMCIADEPVEDGIGDSGVGDGFVPGGHRELTGDDGGACAVAVKELKAENEALKQRLDALERAR